MVYDLIIVAGEPSGDLHAATMLESLYKLNPHLKIAAVSGSSMQKAYPHHQILDIDKLSVMGFIDVVKHAFSLIKYYKQIKKFILENSAKLVLFVDYPGMNLKLSSALKAAGYKAKMWHYIAPTAWAWKRSRVFILKKNLDHLFCILPFEEEFFKSYGVNATYIGHPLVKKLKALATQAEKKTDLIALFPGSRQHEIEKNLPLMLSAFKTILKQHPHLKAELAVSQPRFQTQIADMISQQKLETKITLSSDNMSLMQKAPLAIAKSGTCNLELALLGTPTIVVYAISKLDVWIAKYIFRINLPFLSLPNIILKKEVFAELYGPHFTLENLVFQLGLYLNKNYPKPDFQKELFDILLDKDPAQLLAQKILETLLPSS